MGRGGGAGEVGGGGRWGERWGGEVGGEVGGGGPEGAQGEWGFERVCLPKLQNLVAAFCKMSFACAIPAKLYRREIKSAPCQDAWLPGLIAVDRPTHVMSYVRHFRTQHCAHVTIHNGIVP